MLTIQIAVLTVALPAAGIGIGGGIGSAMLGFFTPGYFQQVFHMRQGVSRRSGSA